MKTLITIILVFLSFGALAQKAYQYDFGASFEDVFGQVGAQPGVTIDEYEDGTTYILVQGEVTLKLYLFDQNEKLESVNIFGTSAAISIIVSGMSANQELVLINGKGTYRHVETGNKWMTVMPHGVQDVWVIIVTKE